jgi:hypothetical protein
MDYFKSLTTTDIAQLITSAKKSVYLCMPSLHSEIADAIAELDFMENSQNENVKIQILIDFDAQTFRQGYGTYETVENLFMGNFDIKCLKDNRISFLISDDIGYYLFIESRSLIPADKQTINAVKIDHVSLVRLKKYFFPDEKGTDFKDELANAIIEESKTLSEPDKLIPEKTATVAEIETETIKEIKADLEKNPPLNPDYKRMVEFYSNKFQYVKLKFKGANLLSRKIEIPAKALPLMDAALKEKLETKLNLFTKSEEEEYFKPLSDFKDKIADLRERYLKKVKSREESLLDKTRKTDFEKEVKDLNDKINELQSEIVSDLATQINETRERLLIDLTEFFIANPKVLFPDHPNLWEGNNSYIQQSAKSRAEKIIHHINWPEAHLLVDGFKLIYQYSDITFEDLKNEEFVSELAESGLINEVDSNQLAEFGKAVALNNNESTTTQPQHK